MAVYHTTIDRNTTGENTPTNRKEVYEKSVLIPFEDIMVPAPVGYDEYLTQLYGGNYMEMPPVEKRQTHHSYTITRKD